MPANGRWDLTRRLKGLNLGTLTNQSSRITALCGRILYCLPLTAISGLALRSINRTVAKQRKNIGYGFMNSVFFCPGNRKERGGKKYVDE